MISHELALKLKNAGFPLQKIGDDFSVVNNPRLIQIIEIEGVRYLVPDLSELIEECGDRFVSLDRLVGNPFAYGNSNDKTIWWSCPLDDEGGTFVNEGSTPEEAVANLWIGLQTNYK